MNIRKLFLASLAIVSLTLSASAQGKQMKIAHINSAELMAELPEVDTVNIKLENLQKEYQRMLDAIKSELAQKETFWEANPTDDSDILLLRQKEYEELVQRYQTTEQEARQGIAKKQAALYEPLFNNLKKVIQEVAVELGYTYVLDSGEGGGMIYSDPAHDLMAAVKERLKTSKL
ncbi:MAG: outer membrane protein [Bacteroidia bacterium]|jgi:outer membrane protein